MRPLGGGEGSVAAFRLSAEGRASVDGGDAHAVAGGDIAGSDGFVFIGGESGGKC